MRLLVFFLFIQLNVYGQMTRTMHTSVNVLGNNMRFITYEPKIPSSSWLIIYPGRGETGPSDGSQLSKVENPTTYAKHAKAGHEFPFNIIIVQVENSFQNVSRYLPVWLHTYKGAKKIAFHGLSLGAQWIYNSSMFPEWHGLPAGYITFLAPISGRPDNSTAPTTACTTTPVIDVPIYAAHGDKDPTVPFSADEKFVLAVNACPGRVNQIIWNPVAGGVHNTWNAEFAKDQTKQVWILTHKYLAEEPPISDRYEEGRQAAIMQLEQYLESIK